MARNEEKAQSMLNKWVTMKETMAKGGVGRRPWLARDCDNLQEAIKWRRELIREVAMKVTEIQNAGLGEHRIRDLNDEINKLLRTKYHWDRRVRELGGRAYMGSFSAAAGLTLPGGGHYKYFGAAKDLPGVRELFKEAEEERKARARPKRSRSDMYSGVTPDYYGWRDEEDGVLLQAEAVAEKKAVAKAVRVWEKERAESKRQRLQRKQDREQLLSISGGGAGAGFAGTAGTAAVAGDGGDDGDGSDASSSDSDTDAAQASAAVSADVKAHVPVPTQDEISKLILQRKKAALLAKYASKDLQSAQDGTKRLLNVKR